MLKIHFLSRLIFNSKNYKMVKKHKNKLKTIGIKARLTKYPKNLVKHKNRHSVNVNLGQRDKKSIIRQL